METKGEWENGTLIHPSCLRTAHFMPFPPLHVMPSSLLIAFAAIRHLNIISSRRGPLETILIGQPICFSRNST